MAMENLSNSVFRGLLRVNRGVLTLAVRHTNRINVQKPRPSHYKRAQIEHLVKPRYFERGERDAWFVPSEKTCLKEKEETYKLEKKFVDNPYEKLLAKDMRNWFMNSKLVAFFHANPIKMDDKFETEVRLRKLNMYLNTLGHKTVKIALEGTPYLPVLQLYTSHTNTVFCAEPNVAGLLNVAAKMHQYVLLAAIVEGRLMSVTQLKALSQLVDLTAARAQLVGVLNAAQSQMVSGLTYHQSTIAAGLQQYSQSQTPE